MHENEYFFLNSHDFSFRVPVPVGLVPVPAYPEPFRVPVPVFRPEPEPELEFRSIPGSDSQTENYRKEGGYSEMICKDSKNIYHLL